MSEEDPNIGQQFTGIVGNDLISSSLKSIKSMQEITGPVAAALVKFKQPINKAEEEHPVTKANRHLNSAYSAMNTALFHHTSERHQLALKEAVGSHQHLMKALEYGLKVPGITTPDSKFITHAADVTDNMIKLQRLYAE